MAQDEDRNALTGLADAAEGDLSSLGVESDTERRVKRVLPWVISLLVHAGLIVMGAFGRNRITDYFLGSNAAAVVRTSPVAVLLAR